MGGEREREKNKRNIILSCKGKHDRSLNKSSWGRKEATKQFPDRNRFPWRREISNLLSATIDFPFLHSAVTVFNCTFPRPPGKTLSPARSRPRFYYPLTSFYPTLPRHWGVLCSVILLSIASGLEKPERCTRIYSCEK